MPAQPNNAFMEGLYQKMRARAVGMAQQINPDTDTTKLSPDEISTLWNTRAMPIEQEWELWRIGRTEGDPRPPLSREEIGLMVYPHRERLGKSGGRIEPNEFTPWINKQAEKEAAKREAQQPPPYPEAPIISTVDGR